MGLSGEENLPTTDSLQNSLAFKGNSTQLFRDAVEEVQRISLGGQMIYSPDFASLREPESARTFKLEPTSQNKGPLNQDEAVALKVLFDENSAFNQHFAINSETSKTINTLLELPIGGMQSDAMDGIVEFGTYVGIAANVREQINRTEPLPNAKKSITNIIKRTWREKFEEPLQQDGLVIGPNTVAAIEIVVAKYAERDITNDPEHARTPEEITARIESRKHGARLAGRLYLEAKELASKIFSSPIP